MINIHSPELWREIMRAKAASLPASRHRGMGPEELSANDVAMMMCNTAAAKSLLEIFDPDRAGLFPELLNAVKRANKKKYNSAVMDTRSPSFMSTKIGVFLTGIDEGFYTMGRRPAKRKDGHGSDLVTSMLALIVKFYRGPNMPMDDKREVKIDKQLDPETYKELFAIYLNDTACVPRVRGWLHELAPSEETAEDESEEAAARREMATFDSAKLPALLRAACEKKKVGTGEMPPSLAAQPPSSQLPASQPLLPFAFASALLDAGFQGMGDKLDGLSKQAADIKREIRSGFAQASSDRMAEKRAAAKRRAQEEEDALEREEAQLNQHDELMAEVGGLSALLEGHHESSVLSSRKVFSAVAEGLKDVKESKGKEETIAELTAKLAKYEPAEASSNDATEPKAEPVVKPVPLGESVAKHGVAKHVDNVSSKRTRTATGVEDASMKGAFKATKATRGCRAESGAP